jgi:hypothetical protein
VNELSTNFPFRVIRCPHSSFLGEEIFDILVACFMLQPGFSLEVRQAHIVSCLMADKQAYSLDDRSTDEVLTSLY